jgi:hypothetical protein
LVTRKVAAEKIGIIYSFSDGEKTGLWHGTLLLTVFILHEETPRQRGHMRKVVHIRRNHHHVRKGEARNHRPVAL